MRLLIAALLLGGCGADERSCTPPAHTTYECEPLPPGSAGCVGGPVWQYSGPTDSGQTHQDDPGAVFPNGCAAYIPDCSPFYRGQPREFICETTAWSEQI